MPDTKIQDLANLGSADRLDRLPIVSVAGPTDNSITVANLRVSMVGSASVPFTDGDTFRRVTITDGSATATSRILVTVQRPDTATDYLDSGYIYTVNVLNRAAGSFDVDIACLDWGMTDASEVPPNETITLCYLIG